VITIGDQRRRANLATDTDTELPHVALHRPDTTRVGFERSVNLVGGIVAVWRQQSVQDTGHAGWVTVIVCGCERARA
jgi:hypothetical protein